MQDACGVVVDIGAADRWVRAYLPEGVHYVALDYPVTGRDLYGARPDVFADGAALPFADASVDGVICLEVLEHVADPARVVAEIARVLRPGGDAWISMPFLYPLHDAPHDYQRYTEFGLRRDLGRAGLGVVAMKRTLSAIATAGLLASLAIAGPLRDRRGIGVTLLAAPAAALVLLVNVTAAVLGRMWPDWGHLGIGYEVRARRE
ncbi:hypothetical protein P873_03100 [Arenimonas composti TR7-09 = DSM 18010]|uniref:Methyltransferase type 11 domain-containing protein n=1 Tax=Arenimonas composti TR7-09 = DSM 18010 TaxID=1121013 RepID=A0A091BI87_9GAMM|nr:hypothetical protein P873_03100 [Arenimonas composti TR7-09 = DSM 18010]